MAFYNQFADLTKKLEMLGHTVLAPELEFKTDGDDTSVGRYFEQHGGVDAFPPDHDVWKKKGKAITTHFKRIDESDAILVVNHEKNGIPNYIGGNTFLEIGYAYGNNKKVFLLNDLPAQLLFKEEMLGMQPTILKGDLTRIA